jgi:hypothetical protein
MILYAAFCFLFCIVFVYCGLFRSYFSFVLGFVASFHLLPYYVVCSFSSYSGLSGGLKSLHILSKETSDFMSISS